MLCSRANVTSFSCHNSGRVVRVGNNDSLGAFRDVLRNVVEVELPVVFLAQRIERDGRAGHERAKGENRVARVRSENEVVRAGESEADMREALLRAGNLNDLVVREVNVIAALVPLFDRVQQLRRFGQRILVHIRVESRAAYRLHHVLVRLKIRRADRQIDNVNALFNQRTLFLVQLIENIAFNRFSCFQKVHD